MFEEQTYGTLPEVDISESGDRFILAASNLRAIV
jgi:hypothetical protein